MYRTGLKKFSFDAESYKELFNLSFLSMTNRSIDRYIINKKEKRVCRILNERLSGSKGFIAFFNVIFALQSSQDNKIIRRFVIAV